MPQMAPLMWCLLFFYFGLLFTGMVTIMFFNASLKTKTFDSVKNTNMMNWKW